MTVEIPERLNECSLSQLVALARMGKSPSPRDIAEFCGITLLQLNNLSNRTVRLINDQIVKSAPAILADMTNVNPGATFKLGSKYYAVLSEPENLPSGIWSDIIDVEMKKTGMLEEILMIPKILACVAWSNNERVLVKNDYGEMAVNWKRIKKLETDIGRIPAQDAVAAFAFFLIASEISSPDFQFFRKKSNTKTFQYTRSVVHTIKGGGGVAGYLKP